MAAQIASALYLHFGIKPAVVHRDVTTSNIFVEADMGARLGDFGLSRLLTPPDACALVERARRVYERSADLLADDEDAEVLFVAFAEFEERCREVERSCAIYKYALDRVPKGRAEELYRKFLAFEKQFGDREGIEDAIVGKRRFQYEEEVRKNPLNYDSWFDYIRLEESVGNKERTREVYERAIANVPPAEEKRYWQRYIYLWINYALYEELGTEDVERTREVYKECLKLIPHKKFTFAKIWLMAAQFEIRQRNLKSA
jgi:crooked neck